LSAEIPGFRGGEGPGIIRREEVLLPDYLPDEVLFREAELQSLADAIKPLVRRSAPANLFVHGPSGCGKTASMKYIIRQLSEYSSAVLPVYVNCWENSTQLAVYNRIVEEMRLPLPRRGLATDEVFSRISQYIRNYRKPVLVVLDDMDGLHGDELLYVLSRSNGKGVLFGIIGIANDRTLLSGLDVRIRSSLRFSELEFRPYGEEQLARILRVRAEHGLEPGSWDERLLAKIARAAEGGSARTALEILWKAAKRAEKAGRVKIMLQDAEEVMATEPSFKLPELRLCSEELLIVELLRGGETESSALYERFTRKIPKTKRQIRNYLELLEKKGMVESEELPGDGMLRPRVFRLRARK
jgi:cell division control protein 6